VFSISSTTIDATELKKNLADRRAGAFVTFEGWVRDHNEGKEVLTLEYEAYEMLCQNEARQILTEAMEKFGVIDVHCVHRTGELKIGELAVWVGVSSSHRGAAFDAFVDLRGHGRTHAGICNAEPRYTIKPRRRISHHPGWIQIDGAAAKRQQKSQSPDAIMDKKI